jgi:hypothetical protein
MRDDHRHALARCPLRVLAMTRICLSVLRNSGPSVAALLSRDKSTSGFRLALPVAIGATLF